MQGIKDIRNLRERAAKEIATNREKLDAETRELWRGTDTPMTAVEAFWTWEGMPQVERSMLSLTVREPLSRWEPMGPEPMDPTHGRPLPEYSEKNDKVFARFDRYGEPAYAALLMTFGTPEDYESEEDYRRDVALSPWCHWCQAEDKEWSPEFFKTIEAAQKAADADLAKSGCYFATTLSRAELLSLATDAKSAQEKQAEEQKD